MYAQQAVTSEGKSVVKERVEIRWGGNLRVI